MVKPFASACKHPTLPPPSGGGKATTKNLLECEDCNGTAKGEQASNPTLEALQKQQQQQSKRGKISQPWIQSVLGAHVRTDACVLCTKHVCVGKFWLSMAGQKRFSRCDEKTDTSVRRTLTRAGRDSTRSTNKPPRARSPRTPSAAWRESCLPTGPPWPAPPVATPPRCLPASWHRGRRRLWR